MDGAKVTMNCTHNHRTDKAAKKCADKMYHEYLKRVFPASVSMTPQEYDAKNHVTLAWAATVLMLEETPDTRTPEQLRAQHEREERESAGDFSGYWVVSLSGVPIVAATPELAEARAAEIERDYDSDESEASGDYTADEVAEMRHPTW